MQCYAQIARQGMAGGPSLCSHHACEDAQMVCNSSVEHSRATRLRFGESPQ
jgi:hypothetical protein